MMMLFITKNIDLFDRFIDENRNK